MELLNRSHVYFVWCLEYIIKKHPAPTKREIFSGLMVKSRNALFHTLLVCFCSCQNSGLRYIFSVLDANRLDSLYFTWVRMWGSMVIFRSQKGYVQRRLGNTGRPIYGFLHFSVVVIAPQTYYCLLFCENSGMWLRNSVTTLLILQMSDLFHTQTLKTRNNVSFFLGGGGVSTWQR
jgi:hypothetical protein